MKLVIVSLLLAVGVAHGSPRDDQSPSRNSRLKRVVIAGIAYVSSETIYKDALAHDECVWCSVNSFDAGVRDAIVWREPKRAATLSNVTGYVAAPLVAAGLLRMSSDDWATWGDDMMPMLETVAYSQLAVQGIKFYFGRQRPYAHYATTPLMPTNDDNLSFISGHSALTFSIAVSTGIVANRRGYAAAPAIWVTGLGLATTTAYLRIAADKHYTTDVLAGSAFGIAAGILIPRWTGSLPHETVVVPTGNGLSLSGTF